MKCRRDGKAQRSHVNQGSVEPLRDHQARPIGAPLRHARLVAFGLSCRSSVDRFGLGPRPGQPLPGGATLSAGTALTIYLLWLRRRAGGRGLIRF